MSSLPASIKVEFKSKWVVSKTRNRFSSIPIDQMHEQENAKVKGKGEVIGLTENPTTLRRWMICGPELARFDTVTGFGNPFEDDCSVLLILNTRACADDSVIETVRSVETLGKAQYQKYKKEVITERTKSIHDSIRRIPWHCLAHLKGKLNPSAVERNDSSLFGRLYIANQQHEGDPGKFFSHENQTTPPSLSDFGKIRLGQKSLLLSCFDSSDHPTPPVFDWQNS